MKKIFGKEWKRIRSKFSFVWYYFCMQCYNYIFEYLVFYFIKG